MPITAESTAYLKGTLNQVELSRLKKFHFAMDRERGLIARGGLRDILSRYLNQIPNNLQFYDTEFGKPYLKNITLNFNVSHSNNCILVAITDRMLIGVDVEYYDKMFEYVSIAGQFFTENESANLLSLPFDKRNRAFYHCWTQKEAFLKGIGMGLHIPLNQFEVNLASSENIKILGVSKKLENFENNNTWCVSNINLGENYIAALATSRKHNNISLWDWEKI